MKTNLPQHPCAGKCTEFKNEQCKTCLVRDIEKREFDLGVAPDEAYVKKSQSDFLIDDVVGYIGQQMTPELRTVVAVFPNRTIISDSNNRFADGIGIRLASTAEIQANRRLTNAELSQAEVS